MNLDLRFSAIISEVDDTTSVDGKFFNLASENRVKDAVFFALSHILTVGLELRNTNIPQSYNTYPQLITQFTESFMPKIMVSVIAESYIPDAYKQSPNKNHEFEIYFDLDGLTRISFKNTNGVTSVDMILSMYVLVNSAFTLMEKETWADTKQYQKYIDVMSLIAKRLTISIGDFNEIKAKRILNYARSLFVEIDPNSL